MSKNNEVSPLELSRVNRPKHIKDIQFPFDVKDAQKKTLFVETTKEY